MDIFEHIDLVIIYRLDKTDCLDGGLPFNSLCRLFASAGCFGAMSLFR